MTCTQCTNFTFNRPQVALQMRNARDLFAEDKFCSRSRTVQLKWSKTMCGAQKLFAQGSNQIALFEL